MLWIRNYIYIFFFSDPDSTLTLISDPDLVSDPDSNPDPACLLTHQAPEKLFSNSFVKIGYITHIGLYNCLYLYVFSFDISKVLFLMATYTSPWRLQGTYRIWDINR